MYENQQKEEDLWKAIKVTVIGYQAPLLPRPSHSVSHTTMSHPPANSFPSHSGLSKSDLSRSTGPTLVLSSEISEPVTVQKSNSGMTQKASILDVTYGPRLPIGKDPIPPQSRVILQISITLPSANSIDSPCLSFNVFYDLMKGANYCGAATDAMNYLNSQDLGIPKKQLKSLQERLNEEIIRQVNSVRVERFSEEPTRPTSVKSKNGVNSGLM